MAMQKYEEKTNRQKKRRELTKNGRELTKNGRELTKLTKNGRASARPFSGAN